jgi:adenylate cyclase class 2
MGIKRLVYMLEIEAKFRVEKIDEIEEKLKEVAEFVVEKIEEDVYFTSELRDFSETDEAVRIRRDAEGVSLTYKGPKIDAETKSREEVKVRIFPEDYENAILFLEKIGLRRFAKVKKRRKIYRIGNALVCIDKLDNLGDFVEIEVESPDLETGKQRIFSLAKTLGISESIRKSYLELLLEKDQ